MELLLAVAEDSATLRSDMSAVYGVGGESDATDIALFFWVYPKNCVNEQASAKRE